jgi:hypothetical protein
MMSGAALLAASGGGGCEGCGPAAEVADVRVEGRCEAVSDPVRFWGRTDLGEPSVGILGEYTLVVVMSWIWDEGVQRGTRPMYYQWFDGAMRPMGERRFLGRGRPPVAATMRFVRQGDALLTWTSVAPEDAPPPAAEDSLVVLRFRPGQEVEREPFTLPLTSARPRCALEATCNWSPFGFADALTVDDGATVIAGHEGGWIGAIAAIPDTCDKRTVNAQRIVVFDDVFRVTWISGPGVAPCSDFQDSGAPSTHSIGAVVPSGPGRAMVLFRLPTDDHPEGWISPRVHAVELEVGSLEQAGEVRVVGRGGTFYGVDQGYQVDAAPLRDGAVLFSERTADGEDRCDELRRIAPDRSAAPTPWQLPCVHDRMHLYTRESELLPLPEGRAAIVWGERTGYGRTESFTKLLTRSTPWSEAIHVAMLTHDGLRASDVLTVTPPEATAVDFSSAERTDSHGPQVKDFTLAAAAEGHDLAVVWHDRRLDAPGLYLRRLRCAPLATATADAGTPPR